MEGERNFYAFPSFNTLCVGWSPAQAQTDTEGQTKRNGHTSFALEQPPLSVLPLLLHHVRIIKG